MRLAIIDLGTNSVRFDVHQFGPGRKVRPLHREKVMVRLGQGAFVNGKLDRSAVQRTLMAFQRFKRVATQLGTDRIRAFGTSALREVADRDRFLALILQKTGIEVRVISGNEEAKLIALGILAHEREAKGKFALIDIGGGSTEVSACKGALIQHSVSFPLGTARLQQLFLKISPPKPTSIQEVRNHIRSTLAHEIVGNRWPDVSRIIGSSGTIRTLAKILEGSDKESFDRESLGDLVERMSKMTTTELLGIDGMEARRVDMILAGAILFHECMEVLGAKKAFPTEYSLRDGILEEELHLYRRGEHSPLGLHLQDLIEVGVKFGGQKESLQAVAALSDSVFTKLQSLHRLRPSWRGYLSAAAVLREVGQLIAPARSAEHSHYVIKHADLPPMEGWENEMLAELARWHERNKLETKELPFRKNKSRREAFLRLLAMLKLVDALDTSPQTRIKLVRVKVHAKEVELHFTGRRLSGLESLNVELQSNVFSQVFGRHVRAIRV